MYSSPTPPTPRPIPPSWNLSTWLQVMVMEGLLMVVYLCVTTHLFKHILINTPYEYPLNNYTGDLIASFCFIYPTTYHSLYLPLICF